MTSIPSITSPTAWVGVDIAKRHNDVLVEREGHRRKRFRVANERRDYDRFAKYLEDLPERPIVGFEATGNYHRPLAFFLAEKGFELRLISSVAASKTREPLFNSWDKNDPKDAQVIIYMLKTGVTQRYHELLIHGIKSFKSSRRPTSRYRCTMSGSSTAS